MDGGLNILTWPRRIAKSRVRVHCILEGEPLSKQRPRLAVTASGKVYTPKQTRQAEDDIGWQIKAAHRALLVDNRSPFGVRVVFCSRSHQRRDIDNMTKLLFDACTGIVWADDSQVIELIAHTFHGQAKAETHLVIYELPGGPFYRTKRCVLCNTEFRTYPSWKFRRFCSARCMGLASRHGFEVPCSNCGTTLYRSAHRFKNSRNMFFCSLKCKTEHTTKPFVCRVCNQSFIRPRSQPRHYCSRACHITALRATAVKRPLGICQVCGAATSKRSYLRCNACQLEART